MLKEQFASQAHEQWSHWMKHLFKVSEQNENGSVTIPKELVDRWKRQMDTNFFLLSDQEQKSDYDQAEKFLKLLKFGNYQARLVYNNGTTHCFGANTLDTLKSKCNTALNNQSVSLIAVEKNYTIGYLKHPILSEQDLLK